MMATATTTAAVAAAAAAAAAATKAIKCGATARVQPLISSSSSTISRRFNPLATVLRKYSHGFPSFCTNANVNTEDPPVPATSSPSGSDGDEKNRKESGGVSVRDAANMLDIRVGRIVKAWRHEEAESLYVEEVDVGEAEPRVICSGLVKHVPIEYLQDRKVVVLANLKPRNMRGVKSSGMLMAASDASHENVELLEPPESSVPGERIWFGNEEEKENQPDPATPNQTLGLQFDMKHSRIDLYAVDLGTSSLT